MTAQDDTLRQKLPPLHIAAQVTGTLACTFLMSFLGTGGTLIGLAVGTVLSSTIPTALEHTASHGSKAAYERYKKFRKRGLNPVQAQAAARQARIPRHGLLVVSALVIFGASALLLLSIESATGKPASDIVQNKAGHGTTFTGGSGGGYTPPVTPAPTESETVTSPASSAGTPSPTATISPSATATASLPPSVTPTPALTSTSFAATAAPTGQQPPASPAPAATTAPATQQPATQQPAVQQPATGQPAGQQPVSSAIG